MMYMKNVELTYLGGSCFILVTGDAVLVFDYTYDPLRRLPYILSQHPGIPVIFMVSQADSRSFSPEIFSTGEMRQRYFVIPGQGRCGCSSDSCQISPVSDGSVLPDLPGGVSVTAFGNTADGYGFLVTTQSHLTIYHTPLPNPGILEGTAAGSIDIAIIHASASRSTAVEASTMQLLERVPIRHIYPVGLTLPPQRSDQLPTLYTTTTLQL